MTTTNKDYLLKSKKYIEKIYNNFVIVNVKKAINYDFIYNKEEGLIQIKNIEDFRIFPKNFTEILFNLLLSEVIEDVRKTKKMDEQDFMSLNSVVLNDMNISSKLHFMLIDVNEWLLNDSFYNVDTLIDFKLRKYKNFFASEVDKLYKEEQIHKEHLAKAKELQDYVRNVFDAKFGLEKFSRLHATLDSEDQLTFKTEEGLELSIDFVQETLGLVLQFQTNESVGEYNELSNRGKLFQLFILALDVKELDVTDLMERPAELGVVCNIFYLLCNALKRQPIIINRNHVEETTETHVITEKKMNQNEEESVEHADEVVKNYIENERDNDDKKDK